MTVLLPTLGKAGICEAFARLSMIQTMQLNRLLSPWITTFTQEMPRSSNAVLQNYTFQEAFLGVRVLCFGHNHSQLQETAPPTNNSTQACSVSSSEHLTL